MPTQPSIAQIISTAKVRQYLSYSSVSFNNSIKNGAFTNKPPKLIFAFLKAVNRTYSLNPDPNDPIQIQVSNFLWWLVSPLISINTNLLSSNLSAMAVSTTEIDLSWTAVPNGVTYTLEHALDSNFTTGLATIFAGVSLSFHDTGLTPNTHYFYRIHVSAPGFTDSPYSFADATTLQIPVTITGFFGYTPTDPYPFLQGHSDPFTYQVSFNIVHDANFTITMPAASAPNQYLIVKVPDTEPLKATWFNDVFNNGTIPDFDWQTLIQFGGFTYYCSRQALSLNTNNTLILSP